MKEGNEKLSYPNKWNLIYTLVIGTLVIIIVFLYFFTEYFK